MTTAMDFLSSTAILIGAGFALMYGIVFIRSALKAPLSREEHAAGLTGRPNEALRGDYPSSNISGKSEALQNGMSFDRKTRRLILQGKLSNEYIDDLVG